MSHDLKDWPCPGVIVFRYVFIHFSGEKKDSQGIILHSEIYQVTGPVERFAGQIASHGYVVGA